MKLVLKSELMSVDVPSFFHHHLMLNLHPLGWDSAVNRKVLHDLLKHEPVWNNPNTRRFCSGVLGLPDLTHCSRFYEDRIVCGVEQDLENSEQKIKILEFLKATRPWRKGPFSFFGIEVETEWASYMKWNRLFPHLDIKGKTVLDIGASSGYYMFRMLSHSPKQVLGIDPSFTFFYQFLGLQHFLKETNLHYLPVKIEALDQAGIHFDVIFCMGVLYHQRVPRTLLQQLKRMAGSQGVVILETLIWDSPKEESLQPKRYAKMPNVRHIPTPSLVSKWAKEAGFAHCDFLSQDLTTPGEQKRTEWIIGESLLDFLDPQDPSKTVEGYPAPLRGIFRLEGGR